MTAIVPLSRKKPTMPLNASLREKLTDLVPQGLVATRAWLMEHGISHHAIDNLVKSGQLRSLVSGVYDRPGTVLTGQGIVCALQRMGSDLRIGGESALSHRGLSHYLSLSEQQTLHLFGYDALPSWMNKLVAEITFERHSDYTFWGIARTSNARKDGLTEPGFVSIMPWSDAAWPLMVSTPELAFLEVLSDVPEHVSFEHADQLMQGLATLSPRRLKVLLTRCRNVKVRRLLFWFAERHAHPWLPALDLSDYDLGRGKRMLVKGGKLDPKYQITVPKHMHG